MPRRMGFLAWRMAWRLSALALVLVAVVVGAVIGVRAYGAAGNEGLRPWHTVVPPEPDVAAMDRMDWAGWLAAEARAFDVVRREVTGRLAPEHRSVANRYDATSPLHPAGFATDWNRSFIMAPPGAPRGAAVLLHGMTDAPYSMRHLARLYQDAGWVAVVPRMPGHGTVPAGLTEADWQDWAAATRLAVREARARAPGQPLHLVGYSNGGALAVLHALAALERPELGAPDRLVLLSPMIGVTAFARFAGLAGLPALLPAFAEAAWLSLLPEFIPFKFNSFPVNAARQSHLLSAEVQARTRAAAAAGRIGAMPPVLTFQSAVDATVSTAAVVSGLHAHLPANGSELVLFDLNRDAKLGPLVAPAVEQAVERLLPAAPQRFAMTLISNAGLGGPGVEERTTPAGAATVTRRPLGMDWPREVFSLSHIALPFPVTDGLYGMAPDPAESFGVRLGAVAARGERGVLVADLDTLLRVSSNPFYDYVRDRVIALIAAPHGTAGAAVGRGADLLESRGR